MKVLLLNTFSHSGGAAVAVQRLQKGLHKEGIDVEVGTFYPEAEDHLIRGNKALNIFLFLLDRIKVRFLVRNKKWLYKFSTSFSGLDITRSKQFEAADIVHLHWVNFGFLSTSDIRKIAKKKPVVWTFHDMWAFTGGCHYSLHCDNYRRDCDQCFYLKPKLKTSGRILTEKITHWKEANFSPVTCSNWLRTCAENSTLFKDRLVRTIGNPIDTDTFKPMDKKQLRNNYQISSDQLILLVGAMDLNDERKGFSYLLEAVELVKKDIPDLLLITFGKMKFNISDVNIKSFGMVDASEELCQIYNMADIFILPSLQDNLPNTAMEALSCGIPVIAFDSGGIKDMVVHKETGYLAKNQDVEDLSSGIKYFQNDLKRERASVQARQHIENNFSEAIISKKYIELYHQAIIEHRDF